MRGKVDADGDSDAEWRGVPHLRFQSIRKSLTRIGGGMEVGGGQIECVDPVL